MRIILPGPKACIPTDRDRSRAAVEYIGWYGSTRHCTLGYRSPAGFETTAMTRSRMWL